MYGLSCAQLKDRLPTYTASQSRQPDIAEEKVLSSGKVTETLYDDPVTLARSALPNSLHIARRFHLSVTSRRRLSQDQPSRMAVDLTLIYTRWLTSRKISRLRPVLCGP